MKRSFLLALLFICSLSTYAQVGKYSIYEASPGKFGVKLNNKVIVEPVYDKISWTKRHGTLFYIIQKNGLTGLVDGDGKTMVETAYDSLRMDVEMYINPDSPENENIDYVINMLAAPGYITVFKDGKQGLVDFDGKLCVKPTYTEIIAKNNLYYVKDGNEKWTLLRRDFSALLPAEYGKPLEYSLILGDTLNTSILLLNKGGKLHTDTLYGEPIPLMTSYGYDSIDANGNVLYLRESYFFERYTGGKTMLLDEQGKILTATALDEVCLPLWMSYDYNNSGDEYVQVASRENHYVIPKRYYTTLGHSLAIVRQNKKFGLLDLTGKKTMALKYDTLYALKDSADFIFTGREKDQEYVISMKEQVSVAGKYYPAHVNIKMGNVYRSKILYTITGKGSKQVNTAGPSYLENGQQMDCSVTLLKGGKYGLKNSDRKEILLPEADSVKLAVYNNFINQYTYINISNIPDFCHDFYSKDSLLILMYKNGKWGAVDQRGKTIIPFKHTRIQPLRISVTADFLYSVWENKNISYIVNKEGKRITDFGADLAYLLVSDTVKEFYFKTGGKYYVTPFGNKILRKDLRPAPFEMWQMMANGPGSYYQPWGYPIEMYNGVGERIVLDKKITNIDRVSPDMHVYSYTENDTTWYGLVDKTGNVVKGVKYDMLQILTNYAGDEVIFKYPKQLFYFSKGYYRGLMDETGKILVPAVYGGSNTMDTTAILFWREQGKDLLYNPYLNKSLEIDVNDIYSVEPMGSFYRVQEPNGDAFLLNRKFEKVSGTEGVIERLGDRFFYVRNQEGIEVRKNNGKVIIPRIPADGVAVIDPYYNIRLNLEGKNTLYDSTGREMLPFQAESIQWNDLLYIKRNDTLALYSPRGKQLTPFKYDVVSRFNKGFAWYDINFEKGMLKVGIINQQGKEITPARYSSLQITDRNNLFVSVYGDKMVVQKDGKWGIIDTTGKERVPCTYDKIQDIKGGRFYVYKDNKVAMIDGDGKFLRPAFIYTDVYDGPDSLGNYRLTQQTITSTDTTYTYFLADSTWKLLVPAGCASVSALDPVSKHYRLRDHDNKIMYYDAISKMLVKACPDFDNSLYGIFFIASDHFNSSPRWRSTAGPYGSDATAFYVDDNNDYWLGTGSSGGVYYSNDKGKTWQERNKGIGPRHVIMMDKIRDTLFIVTPNYDSDNGYYQTFFYAKKTSGWIPLGLTNYDEMYYRSADREKKIRERLRVIYDTAGTFIYSTNQYQPDNTDYRFMGTNVFYNRFPYEEGDNQKTHLLGLSKNAGFPAVEFPKDMFAQEGGNLFYDKDSALIVLSKSGIFKAQSKHLTRLQPSGLQATDIRQLVQVKEGYYALVGNADIWYYNTKNNSWKHVFDGYTFSNKTTAINPAGYMINELGYDDENSILFGLGGEIFRMKGSSCKKVLSADSVKVSYGDSDTRTFKLYPLNAVSKGKIYYGTGIIKRNAVEDDLEYVSFKYEKGKYKILREFSNRWGFMMKDKKDNIWVYDSENVSRMVNDSTYDHEVACPGTKQLNCFSFAANGDIALLLSYNEIAWYRAEKNDWTVITHGNSENYMTCISFDHHGNILVGTGVYRYEGCGGYGPARSGKGIWGLNYHKGKFTFKPVLVNLPNQWILSLAPHKDGLMVGTSGSGGLIIDTRMPVSGK